MTKAQSGEKATNPIEQFVLLAKSAKGAAAAELIKQVLEAPGVHVFGELLDMSNVIELADGDFAPYFKTLNLFAYGTYRQYLGNQAELLSLSPSQRKKLQHLTIVTLATNNKCIPYSVLLQELDVKNVRDLEDLIIEAIYADIIQGKLDQKNGQLEVDFAIGRDVRREDITGIVKTLQEWCQSCEAVLSCIEEQVDKANVNKTASLQHKESIQRRISEIKKSLKVSNEQEDCMVVETREAMVNSDKVKKPSVKKSARSGPKFWPK